MSQVLAQVCHKIRWPRPRGRIRAGSYCLVGETEPLLHQTPEITLECSTLDSWTEMLELSDCNSAVFQHMTKGEYLSIREVVSSSEDVLPNRQFSTLLNLCKLSGKAASEEFDPTGHVHVFPSNTLESPVEGDAVPVVVLTDREQSLEVIARSIETQGREQRGRATVTVDERMNVNQLKLGDPAGNNRVYVGWSVQSTDEFAHEDRNIIGRRWRVDRFASRRVDDIVLDTAVLPRRG